MIRSDTFKISDKPFAIDLSSFKLREHRGEHVGRNYHYWTGHVRAVWYRRKNGVTYAVIGSLGDHQNEEPGSVEEFLARNTDGRYGGHAHGRWDGRSYFSHHASDADRVEHMKILVPMLEAFPEGRGAQPPVPEGYSGWWRY